MTRFPWKAMHIVVSVAEYNCGASTVKWPPPGLIAVPTLNDQRKSHVGMVQSPPPTWPEPPMSCGGFPTGSAAADGAAATTPVASTNTTARTLRIPPPSALRLAGPVRFVPLAELGGVPLQRLPQVPLHQRHGKVAPRLLHDAARNIGGPPEVPGHRVREVHRHQHPVHVLHGPEDPFAGVHLAPPQQAQHRRSPRPSRSGTEPPPP